MAFDFKKEYKEFYRPKNKPEIVTVQIILQSEERVIQTKKAVHISRQLVYYMRLHILWEWVIRQIIKLMDFLNM